MASRNASGCRVGPAARHREPRRPTVNWRRVVVGRRSIAVAIELVPPYGPNAEAGNGKP